MKWIRIVFVPIGMLLLFGACNVPIERKQEKVVTKALRYCTDCKTIDDARAYERSIGAEEIELTTQQVIEVFEQGDYSIYRKDTSSSPFTHDEGTGFKFYRRLNAEGLIELVKYDYIYPEKRSKEKEYGLLYFALVVVLDQHPSLNMDKPMNGYSDSLSFLYNAYLNHLKAEFPDSAFSISTIQLGAPIYNYTNDKKLSWNKEQEELITTFYSFCCAGKSVIRGYGLDTKMPIKYYHQQPTSTESNFYVLPKEGEDYLEYHRNNPDFYLVDHSDLAICYGITFNNKFEDRSKNFLPFECADNCGGH